MIYCPVVNEVFFFELTVDNPQRIEVCWGSSVDAEDLLSVPDHSGQVARQHHLQGEDTHRSM